MQHAPTGHGAQANFGHSQREMRSKQRKGLATRGVLVTVLPFAVLATPSAAWAQSDPATTSSDAKSKATSDEIIVTGSRSLNRKASESTSPIDVISAQTLKSSGSLNLGDALVKTNPSLSTKMTGNDQDGLTANIVLRGLSPNHTLILVDGIRRHPTSNISADPSPQQGASAPDINMIPAAAIDHIEVLRDGAAAQYGSDAIAGVINIITKKSNHGLNIDGESGVNANGTGLSGQLDIDGGLSFGNDGYVHVGAQFYHHNYFVAKTLDDRTGAFAAGGFDFPGDINKALSVPRETRETLSISAGETVAPDTFGGIKAYGLVTYGHRTSDYHDLWRTPDSLPQVYPDGYSPQETNNENDFAVTVGLKAADVLGFHVNLSSTYGQDQTDIGVKDTANTNLYAATGATPTRVLAQTQRAAQWTNNVDAARLVKILGMPVNIAFGGEHRYDQYKLGVGDAASYELGGTQGFPGLVPQNTGRWSRDVFAGYVDVDVHPIRIWDIDFAGRYEHYTDSGNDLTGKISTRLDLAPWLAVRGTVSNGFSAPTLAQEHYSSLNVGPTEAQGSLAPNSAAAEAIGARPLRPEKSHNYSAGVVIKPLARLSITADVYQIDIKGRIVAAGGVTGQAALDAILATGASVPSTVQPAQVSAFYLANGANTRSRGLDIDVRYSTDLGRYGTVNWSADYNLNRTKVTRNYTDAQGDPFLNAQTSAWIATASPRSKLILGALWNVGKFDITLRETRWGHTTDQMTYWDLAPPALQYSATQFAKFVNPPAWLTDLEVGYQVSPRLHLSVGGSNIFNKLPKAVPPENAYVNVLYHYDTFSNQIPITGGYYYGRIGLSF